MESSHLNMGLIVAILNITRPQPQKTRSSMAPTMLSSSQNELRKLTIILSLLQCFGNIQRPETH